jgi:hypothetical protein
MSGNCSHTEKTERIRGDGTIVILCANPDCPHKFGELAE